ncbi:hypothetical protein HYT56_00245 [Candidatus Woesearchaeota archaeon]|nr:hypothetical protein [Candidatus Woesearchaeota archaeon]
MKTITQVGQKTLANLFGIFGVFYGVVIGLFLALFSNIGSSITGTVIPSLGIISIIISPIAYGAVGYVSGYFSASVYNKIIVPKLGGIEIELE